MIALQSKFIRELAKATGIYSLGHLAGSIFFKFFQDYVVSPSLAKKFDVYTWSIANQYINQYSFSWDNPITWIFGIISGIGAVTLYFTKD